MKIKEKINNWENSFCSNEYGEDIRIKEAIGFSFAGFGESLLFGFIAAYLMVFMTDALGFGNSTDIYGNTLTNGSSFWMRASTSVAFLMLGCKVFDALNDPIMGSIVDNTRSKYGKCRPYLRIAPALIGLFTILCFLPVYPNNVVGFSCLAVVYIIWSITYTIYDVPYYGITSIMSKDTNYRSRLLSLSRLFCGAGYGFAPIIVPPLAQLVDKNYGAEGLSYFYFIVAIVFSILAIPLMYLGFSTSKERYISDKPAQSISKDFRLFFKNTPLLLVFASGILGCARMVYTGAGGLYFAKYALKEFGGEGLFTLISILILPGGFIGTILCPWLQKKFGKKWTFIGIHIFGGIIMLAMYFIGYDEKWKLILDAIGLILVGLPQGISNVMSYGFIGDSIDYLEWKTGERVEGISFATQTFVNKINNAAIAFIGVMAYAVAGFTEDSITVAGKDALWQILILSAAVSMFACTIPMFFYKFTEKEQRKAIKEIEQRKEMSKV